MTAAERLESRRRSYRRTVAEFDALPADADDAAQRFMRGRVERARVKLAEAGDQEAPEPPPKKRKRWVPRGVYFSRRRTYFACLREWRALPPSVDAATRAEAADRLRAARAALDGNVA